jgi:hypothetical protein
MELAALEAEMTDSDWMELTDVILAALAFSDEEILSEARKISRFLGRISQMDWSGMMD